MRHNIQQVAQKDETYKRKPGNQKSIRFMREKGELTEYNHAHVRPSWSAHVTPLASNCRAVRALFYQMTGLTEICTIFIYFLTSFASQSIVSKEEGENIDAGVEENKGKIIFTLKTSFM